MNTWQSLAVCNPVFGTMCREVFSGITLKGLGKLLKNLLLLRRKGGSCARDISLIRDLGSHNGVTT
jgi:hypothetical protein